MIRQPIFWLMYFMFVIVGAGGLMVTANLKPIAVDWKVDSMPVTLIGMTMTAVTFAATIDRILNGLTRPFFGWVSDMIGRENTMFIAFGMEGVGIWALYMFGHDPVWFVILSGFVFFAWGEIYSLFPSTCTDTFGAKFATTNAGLLYTAKGTAALLVPVANYMQQSSGVLGSGVHHRGRRQHSGLAAGDRGAQTVAQESGGGIAARLNPTANLPTRARPPGRARFHWRELSGMPESFPDPANLPRPQLPINFENVSNTAH